MISDIHVLVWDTNDVYAALCHSIENQMHPLRKTVVAVLDILTILAGIWILGEPLES